VPATTKLPRGRPLLARHGARGFTLVELLIVGGLLAVLASVAMPLYQDSRHRAREQLAAQEINAMAGLLSRYQTDRRVLPETLDEVGLGGKLDPWGRPYVYYNVESNGRGGARKDRRLNPLNTDFDLYTMGRDGKTKPQVSQKDSRDDVIRANNGRYVGLADHY
jgi:general secretion pathway protein G